MKQAQDSQKSYADLKRKDVEFEVGDKVFVKVSPYKRVMRFGGKGKLAQGYMDLLKDRVHNVFRFDASKYVNDPSTILRVKDVEVEDHGVWERSIQILDRKIKELRNKRSHFESLTEES
ncbi:uncharacterized protein LOC116121052 [Pistacia vera]|uniref:uncharacterized protein LOC116121052 n=1 Tax=Pistacia vera TaxID=55513 RepID=UPI001262B3FE|nr:uncharacterized protein LOC116121052 [Pistacia vera]